MATTAPCRGARRKVVTRQDLPTAPAIGAEDLEKIAFLEKVLENQMAVYDTMAGFFPGSPWGEISKSDAMMSVQAAGQAIRRLLSYTNRGA
jgi:hypothetical protein